VPSQKKSTQVGSTRPSVCNKQ